MVYVVTVYVVGEQWGTKVLSMLIKVVETLKVPKEILILPEFLSLFRFVLLSAGMQTIQSKEA